MKWEYGDMNDVLEDYALYAHVHHLPFTVGYTFGERKNPCVLVDGDSVYCEVDRHDSRAKQKVVAIAKAMNDNYARMDQVG